MIFNNHTVISAAKGAPTTWLKIEPLISTGNYVGIIKNSPAAPERRQAVRGVHPVQGRARRCSGRPATCRPIPMSRRTIRRSPKQGGYKATTITNEMALEQLPRWTDDLQEAVPVNHDDLDL